MSTMKKLFALTLALAMLMSGAAFAADFTDETTIDEDCVADVNLLTAIGIIKGNEDGSFGPKNTIKRSEAAAMIYRLRNGGVDDGAEAWKGASSFTDVAKDIWYSGYVAYCENYGIIDGKSATIFDPNAPVTTPELAKMLLTVADYKSDIEGYTGSNWSKNVLTDATDAGLFEGFGGSYAGACSREWACKMMANALETYTAAYLGDYKLPLETETVGEKYLDLGKETAIVIANDEYSIDYVYDATSSKTPVRGVAPAAKDSIIISDKTSRNDLWNTYKTVKYDLPTDMVGQQVVIAYKEGNEAGVENAEKIYGVVPTGKTVKGELTISKTTKDSKNYYTAKIGDKVYLDAVEESTINNYKLYGTVFGSDANVSYDSDYMQYVVTAADKVRGDVVMPNLSWVWLNPWMTQKDYAGSDYTYTAYDMDGDGDLDRVIMTHSVYGVVDSIVKDSDGVAKDIVVNFVKATTFTDASKTYAIEDIEIVGTVAAGSVVKADVVDGKVVLTAVTKQTGVLEAVYSKGVADGGYNNLVIDGKKYSWAQTQDAFGAYSLVKSNENDMTAAIQENLIGKKVNFYLTTNGRMLAIPTLWTEESSTPADPETLDYSKLAYIIDANSYTVAADVEDEWGNPTGETKETTYNKVKVMWANGLTEVITYVDVTNENTKADYLTFADLYDSTKGELKDGVAGTVVEFATSGSGYAFKKELSKASKVIYGSNSAAGAVEALGLSNMIALNEAKDRFGSYLTNDDTLVFVKYVKTDKNDNKTDVYTVMKVSEFKELADGVEFNVIARDTGLISTTLVASVAFDGDLPADKEEEVDPTAYLIYVTGSSVNTTFGTDDDGNAIQVSKFTAIDLNTGVEGTYYVKGLNKKVTVGDILEGELDEDGYIATLPTAKTFTDVPATLGKNTWYVGTLKEIVSGVMLIDDTLIDSSNFASKVTVYSAKTSNSAVLTVSALADIVKVATDKSDNVVFRTDKDGEINMVLFTADGKAF